MWLILASIVASCSSPSRHYVSSLKDFGYPNSISEPPEIHEALEQLQATKREIEYLSSQLAIAQRRHDQLERISNANRASRTSISTLPEELLLQVFEASVEHDPYLTTRLLFVCRRWHNVAIKAPHLWASISFKFGNEWDMKCAAGKAKAMYMAHIARSGSNPLHIHIDIAGLKSSRDRLHDFISTYILSLEPGMDAERVMNARIDWPTSWTPPDDSPRNIIHICELFEWLKESDDVQRNRWETLSLALPGGKEEQDQFWPLFCYTAPNLTSFTASNLFDHMLYCHASPRFPCLEALSISGCVPSLYNLSRRFNHMLITRIEIIFKWDSDYPYRGLARISL
ncbi:hypothetical protein M408DRAFT_23104 [Serendipita vermifera MAFF 305830]|uniref:F-box domain-containing protein n=1 Tax=Serendipita vermifera MAFF 305830 TaxID=933852 RepID=A0A0C3AXS4_SERVB|nr:hypothetical protein M408DRAFT_23104 [Serendipita vermifera MAFF 305830]